MRGAAILHAIARNRRSRNIYDGANESAHAQINLEGCFVRDLAFCISLSLSFLLLSKLVLCKAFSFFFKLMLKELSSFQSGSMKTECIQHLLASTEERRICILRGNFISITVIALRN